MWTALKAGNVFCASFSLPRVPRLCATLYLLATECMMSQKDPGSQGPKVPLGLPCGGQIGEEGSALKLLTLFDSGNGHAFGQSLWAKIIMSTDNSNYGLIFSTKGDGQRKRNETTGLTRVYSSQLCTQGTTFEMWFHLAKLNLLIVWTTLNIFISHNVWT